MWLLVTVYLYKTRFGNVYELIIQVEELRVALAHRPAFAAHKAFAALDPLGNGCLTSESAILSKPYSQFWVCLAVM